MSAAPRTARGEQTRRRILEAAEHVFAEHGYTESSVSRITERAGVGQGTFYLYFDSKLDVFDELVEDLNHRVRQAMSEGARGATTRLEAEREGFAAFFRFTAEHPALYRVVREAEFVSPGALRLHYTRIVEGYIDGLRQAQLDGEISDIDPTVAAWALMGIGEMIGMRWVLWGNGAGGPGADADPTASGTDAVPEHVLDEMMRFIGGALGRGDRRGEGEDS
ncbi:TetR/AcrR family transcriptional regulator [Agromyces kandeliae]|uniref:TetR family transcriptional regulator n=1 Tax=Agromyces kandeliae TaxID=2666141 RepID=A0A6L5QYL7_9MICO|nr:TetR/AcrR family transcriptional regulator [Agromyces kandeliae]MRX42749.1 TetR family transcriptional regulator [Agromyces kandeliae]